MATITLPKKRKDFPILLLIPPFHFIYSSKLHKQFSVPQCGTENLLPNFTFNAKSFKKIDAIIPP